MKTSTLNASGAGPVDLNERQPQAGRTAPYHLEVTSTGTETGNLCADETEPVYVHDGIVEEDLARLAGKVAPTKKVRLGDGSIYQMGLGARWTRLHGPAADLHAIKVSWLNGVSGELLECTLGAFLDLVEQGTCARKVESIRALYSSTLQKTGDPKKAKDAVSDLKKGLAAITPSGFFEGQRRRECLVQYTKIICYDLDHCDAVGVMAAVPQCPCVQAGFVSPTETGVKLFVPVDAADDGSNHLDLWQAGKRMLKQHLNVDVDESRKDITGLCFISAGPVYRNLYAKPVTLEAFPPGPKQDAKPRADVKAEAAHPETKAAAGEEKVQAAAAEAGGKPLFQLDASLAPEDSAEARKVVVALQYIDPSPENVWREVGMALKAQWGDAAWDLFEEWSANGDGYDVQENVTRWDSFRDDPDAGITLGTIFHHAKEGGWKPYKKKSVALPIHSNSSFCRAVYKIIAPTHTVFLQGGQTVCIEVINGQPEIVAVDAHKGIRLFEKHIQFLKQKTDEKTNEITFIPVPLAEQHAKLLVKGVQPGELPELKGVTFCPTLVERTLETGEKELPVAGQGYIPETGWFNASPLVIKIPPLAEAVAKLKWLYREFDFPTPGDRSRDLVYPIGVALKQAGLIKGFVPLDFGTANDQQSGKGTRQRMTAALFNRRMELITQSDLHIGGTSEMFKSACLAGKMFIQLDNFDHFQCREMEAFLTGENVRMRDAYGRSRSVDPANFFVFLSSNGLAARRDLALRSWFIRILKRPEGYQFHKYRQGGIVEHILAHQAKYLGCIFAICLEWWKRYCPRTQENRHAFMDFTQACDWIAQNILGEAPVMEGHAEAQEQYSDAGKVFFLRLWDVLAKQGKLDRFFRAGQLATTAFRYSVPIPGLRPYSQGDENAGAKLIGSLAADVFDEAQILGLGQGKTVERRDARSAEDWDELNLPPGGKLSPCYLFKQKAEQAGAATPSATHQEAENCTQAQGQPWEPPAEREPQDQLVVFRDSLLEALADAKKPAPCKVSTQEIARLFQDCSVNSAGRWMANLAGRYPKRFVKADTEHWRGWQILG